MRYCLSCDVFIGDEHFNRKRCQSCSKELVHRPVGRLTKAQEKVVRRLAGKMPYEKLAKKIGSSRSNLMRWARDRDDVSLDSSSYKSDVVKDVCSYYEKHGKEKTQKRFPKVNVRSIVERHKLYKPRQVRWKGSEIVELAKMAGLISFEAQAKYFNRPNANAGSIRSFWMKRGMCAVGSVNGMAKFKAKHLCSNDLEYIKVFGNSRSLERVRFLNLALWVEMEKHLEENCPQFIKEAIFVMADFQRWLFGNRNTKNKILKMIRERENPTPEE